MAGGLRWSRCETLSKLAHVSYIQSFIHLLIFNNNTCQSLLWKKAQFSTKIESQWELHVQPKPEITTYQHNYEAVTGKHSFYCSSGDSLDSSFALIATFCPHIIVSVVLLRGLLFSASFWTYLLLSWRSENLVGSCGTWKQPDIHRRSRRSFVERLAWASNHPIRWPQQLSSSPEQPEPPQGVRCCCWLVKSRFYLPKVSFIGTFNRWKWWILVSFILNLTGVSLRQRLKSCST